MTVAKIGAPDEYIGSFLGSLLDSSEANRVHKDDFSLLVFPGTTPLSLCVRETCLPCRLKLQAK